MFLYLCDLSLDSSVWHSTYTWLTVHRLLNNIPMPLITLLYRDKHHWEEERLGHLTTMVTWSWGEEGEVSLVYSGGGGQ